ncbi:MAG: glycoside hydrolase family 18 protein [Fimbriimonas sp.]
MLSSLVVACVAMAPSPVLAGYLPSWKMPEYDLKRLAPMTDVLYFSIQPTAEGQLELKDIRLEEIPELQKAKRRYGFRLLVCCGGWERSAGFMPMASVPERRSRFVAEVDLFLAKHGFDGIDLDWEHPKDAGEAKAYGELIRDLRKTLAPKGRIVTAAIASWQAMSPEAVKGLDRVHLMSYDHPKRHATMELAKSDVAKLRAMGFPSEKIVLGLPLYGRSLKNWEDAKAYGELRDLFKPEPTRDEAGDYYFNGASTVEAKAKYARKERLAGLMVWEVSQDATGVSALLPVMRRGLGLPAR